MLFYNAGFKILVCRLSSTEAILLFTLRYIYNGTYYPDATLLITARVEIVKVERRESDTDIDGDENAISSSVV